MRLRKWLAGLGLFLLSLAILLATLVNRIDRTPLAQQDFYVRAMHQLDSLQPATYASTALTAAWGKVNITPTYAMPMAGYKLRPAFTTVHDSLYARFIVIDNGKVEVILLSADLLIFPPALRTQVESRLQSTKPMFRFYSATHTHNSVGGWHAAWGAQFAVGDYNPLWIDSTANLIVTEIEKVRRNLQPARASYWQADASTYAANRLKEGNPYDGQLRGLRLAKEDSSHAYLVTFSAHATSISSKSSALSGDYPAALIQHIEGNTNRFALFMAGMVGSHKLSGIAESEFAAAEAAGNILAEKVLHPSKTQQVKDATIKTMQVPVEYGPSQMRLNKDYRLRNWIFSSALNSLQGELTCLQLDNVLLIGTPCDFSGEIAVTQNLEAFARAHNKQLIITSFNGNYTGYITADVHYETTLRAEVTTMNWVGPYFGQYYTDMIQKIILK
ncbi:MAG: neutral/alkaline non-lysosomal ceramidase N-terminal domain-containing protein [Cytophagales bacterium]|nr:neutral/alkaline non-lysosomal ceramidase N-terminal domain-containing protein [Cytophagales bacterium]